MPENTINDKPNHRGIKIFCLLIATIFLAVACILAGFHVGYTYNTNDSVASINQESALQNNSEVSADQIYAKASKSVVSIIVYSEKDSASLSQASGVIYSEDGYIITNDHIYDSIPSAKFKICTSDGKVYPAVYIAGDSRSDLAVLKITDKVKLIPAEFADSDAAKSGEMVCAIGYPNGYNSKSTITTGVVSVPKIRIANGSNYASNLIQTDAPINPGNSGGALVDSRGRVLGITFLKLNNKDYEGVGYAIPSKTIKKLVSSLINFGKVNDRAKLGISYRFYNEITAEVAGIAVPGLEISDVLPESKVVGYLNTKDIITHVNNIKVTDDSVLLDILDESQPGDSIILTVVRTDGTLENVTVTLIADPGTSSYTVE